MMAKIVPAISCSGFGWRAKRNPRVPVRCHCGDTRACERAISTFDVTGYGKPPARELLRFALKPLVQGELFKKWE